MLTWIIRIGIAIVVACIYSQFRSNAMNPPKPDEVSTYTEIVKLPFKQVRQIYALNPDRLRYEKVRMVSTHKMGPDYWLLLNYTENPTWELYVGKSFFDVPVPGIYVEKDKIVAVQLSALDGLRFKRARKKSPNRIATEQAILETMQLDIDKLRDKAQEQIDEAQRIQDQVIRSMRNDA